LTLHGPKITSGGVLFRLWAPDQGEIQVEVDGLGASSLTELEYGWREAFMPCEVGARYRFRKGDIIFPDPASRLQQGGVHGWSIVCADRHPSASWLGRPWESSVIYECHPGLMGGFAGIKDALPELAEMGITAIELMPIAAFPGSRNWGYDGVLSFAPTEVYGTPDQLQALIRAAHDAGLMIFLDVVYNHFGPDGNYLPCYAAPFFRADMKTAWGSAIDFRKPQVRHFFLENARYWLFEMGFDGLRLDAVHAIRDEGWLPEFAATLRSEAGERSVHLILENDDNSAGLVRSSFDAQWNDDIHHVLHVLLTGETHGYYADYADRPAEKLAKALSEGFIFQGEPSRARDGKNKGEPSGDLQPTSFVSFLQNHDQTGNRPFGERLITLAEVGPLQAATALLLLSPQIPMLFMGEEIGSYAPFQYFIDHGPELAQIVREGRAREFYGYEDLAHGLGLPDPNAPQIYATCRPDDNAPNALSWRAFYRALLETRRRNIAPNLRDAVSLGATVIGTAAVRAAWLLGNGRVLTIACNLGPEALEPDVPKDAPIWGDGGSLLPAGTTKAWVTT
jgi:maltooligosyltrehalose trehalohydrolase